MKCEKCGYNNSEFDIICEKCGSPLNIEKNIELQKKYNHKQRAIDIEPIIPDNPEMVFNSAKKKITNVLIVLFFFAFLLMVVIIFNFIKSFSSKDKIVEYNNLVKYSNYGVVYLGTSDKINSMLEDYASETSFDYVYLNTKKLTRIKKRKIRKDLELNKIKETVVILEKGKTKAYLNDCTYTDKDKIISFLTKKQIIPKDIEQAKKVIKKFDDLLLDSDPVLVYLANKQNDISKENNNMFLKL